MPLILMEAPSSTYPGGMLARVTTTHTRRRPSMLALLSSVFSRLSGRRRPPLLSLPTDRSGRRRCRGMRAAQQPHTPCAPCRPLAAEPLIRHARVAPRERRGGPPRLQLGLPHALPARLVTPHAAGVIRPSTMPRGPGHLLIAAVDGPGGQRACSWPRRHPGREPQWRGRHAPCNDQTQGRPVGRGLIRLARRGCRPRGTPAWVVQHRGFAAV
jgi:hypothetical protein